MEHPCLLLDGLATLTNEGANLHLNFHHQLKNNMTMIVRVQRLQLAA